MAQRRTAIYPGSFDPLTNGHVNIIERGLGVFDRVLVALAVNIRKEPMFSLDERIAFIEQAFPDRQRVVVESFDGLLVEHARARGACAILRGLRAVSDFEYELKMAHMNRRLDDAIETVFMMTEAEHAYVSSSLIKEVARFGGDVQGLVPDHVHQALLQRFSS